MVEQARFAGVAKCVELAVLAGTVLGEFAVLVVTGMTEFAVAIADDGWPAKLQVQE